MSVWRTKSIEQSIEDTDDPEYQLKKRLTWLDLTVFGVGVVIGAGIFTLTGRAAQAYAGPGIVLSFVIAGVCCALAALCYAEFASAVPVSGSAYTFSYATLGELVAWIIGWDLLLELMLGAAVVAQGWSAYAQDLLDKMGITWPASIGYDETAGFGHPNLLALLLVVVLGTLVTIGIKESMRVNLVLVGIKVFIVLFVIIAGLGFINADNYDPFIPPAEGGVAAESAALTPLIQLIFGIQPQVFGVLGVVTAASIVFFAYIGFDVVATTAEEAKNPKRDLPIGILGSLAICTVLYMAVCLVVTGMVKYTDLEAGAPLASAFESVGRPGFATLISAGAVAGLTTVVMTLMIGAARVLFAMSRDSLVPPEAGKVHGRFGTPVRITDRDRRGRRPGGGVHPDRQARGDGEHRHPGRVHPGVDRRRRPASHPSRPRAPVPGAAVAGAADPVGADLRLPDAQPVAGDLAALPGLDGARVRHLLLLRVPPLPAGHRETRWPAHERVPPARRSEAPARSGGSASGERAVERGAHGLERRRGRSTGQTGQVP